jgi:DNA-binding transcriptional LysR family regulator
MLSAQSLKMFIAVADERHFARAADALNISQSVVSKQLQRLEDQLGMLLVNRGKRSAVTLTREGALFLDEARAAVERLEQAERIGQNIARGAAGPLKLGYVFSAVMAGLVPRAMRALRDQFPEIQLVPALMETPEQLAAIAAGRIDIGLVRPRPSYPPGILSRVAHREGLVVGMEADHPLAAGNTVRAEALAGENFIVPQFHEQVGLIDNIEKLAKTGGFPMPPILRTSDFITAAAMAAAGMGVVLAPQSLSQLHLDGICYRPVRDHHDMLEIVMIYRDDAPSSPLSAIRAALDATSPARTSLPADP